MLRKAQLATVSQKKNLTNNKCRRSFSFLESKVERLTWWVTQHAKKFKEFLVNLRTYSFIHNFSLRLAIYGRAVAVFSLNRHHWAHRRSMAFEWTTAKRQVSYATSFIASGIRSGLSSHCNRSRQQLQQPREMIPFIFAEQQSQLHPAHLPPQVNVPKCLVRVSSVKTTREWERDKRGYIIDANCLNQ